MTAPLALRASSGNAQIDQITAGVITIFETHFPTRIGGYYFQGSCAGQATTALSDIDLHVVFRTQPSATEQQEFAMLRTALQHISPRPLDLSSSHELAFENHFLAIYKDYLRHEQTADDAIARQFAVERLQRIG